MKIDWSSLWKKEDWWAVWIGFAVLLLGIARWLPKLPVIKKWTSLAQSLPNGASTLGNIALLFIFILALTLVGMALMGKATRKYVLGFLVIFGLSFLAIWVGKFASFTNWGLESVLWAVLLGLIVSNIFKVPEWLKSAVQTEFFIKIGLVLLGAEILFSTIAKGGLVAIAQALLVVIVVWFAAYWVARRFGMDKEFAGIMASGVSICGVSAAIAAGGALKGSPKHVSYVISLVLLVAMPMIIFMPVLAKAIGLAPNVAGAWMGGTIDTTAAVAATGTLVSSDTGLQVASLVKMAQNVLIGFAAFFLAIWSTFTSRKGPGAAANETGKPRLIDIWYRLPKFILGFILASVIFSLVVEPSLGTKTTSAILGVTKGYREWFFALAFVSIGLDTRFKDLVAVGRGKPLAAFVTAQAFNIVWALLVVWLLWSGTFFAAPIK
ncbi:MAG: putative sulfate exporter family transporter [Dehalococcoidia bacterium]|nr:MAG: putative sulfate exporter family transporter [Dehalococcoidia bacterium]